MERGAINGIPVWISLTSITGNERTVIKEAPGVDGAAIEVQGQAPARYAFEFTLISDGEWIVDDYEFATLELRSMLLAGGPFTIEIPVFVELSNLWLAEPYQLTFFDQNKRAITSGSFSLVEGEPYPVLQEDAIANVEAAIAALSESAVLDFGNRAPALGFSDASIATLIDVGDWLASVKSEISNAFEPVTDFAADIQELRGDTARLLAAPQNYASKVMRTAAGVLSLIPSLSSQGDTEAGSAAVQDGGNDKPSVVFTQALTTGEAFDADREPTLAEQLGDDASEEDLAEQDEVNSATSLALTAVISSVCLATTSTPFTTVDSVLSVADALAGPVLRLLDLEALDYRVFSNARYLWKSTLAYLNEQAVDLPRLRTLTVQRNTDVFTVLPSLYTDLGSEADVLTAVDSLQTLNAFPDPMNIVRGTTVRYLEPLV